MINNAKQGGFYVSIFRDEAPEVLSGVSVFVVIAASIFMLGIYAALLRLPDCFRGFSGLSCCYRKSDWSFSGLVFHIPY